MNKQFCILRDTYIRIVHWDKSSFLVQNAQTVKLSVGKETLLNMSAANGVMQTAAKGSHFLNQNATAMDQFTVLTVLRAVQQLGPSITKDEIDGAMEALLEIFNAADVGVYEASLRTQLFRRVCLHVLRMKLLAP